MKKTISTIIILIMGCFMLSACGQSIVLNSTAEDYIGKNFSDVVSEFTDYGFESVETKAVNDIDEQNADQKDTVVSVSIADEQSFEKDQKFDPSDKVIIEYHDYKKIAVSWSPEEMATIEYSKLIADLKAAGFTDVSVSEVYDLDPDEFSGEFKNEVHLNNIETFSKGDEFYFNAPIHVTVHYPYEKYDVTLHIKCNSNLLFNKYNLVATFADQEVHISHGETEDITCRVKKDTYELNIQNAEDSSISKTISLEVSCNIEAAYNVTCNTDELSVEEEYVDRDIELADDEVKMTCSNANYVYKNFEEVKKELEGLGFSNITTKVLYDIVFGITAEGSVESLTIDGKDSFKRGDIFKKDAAIVITYHSDQDNDPSKAQQETSKSSVVETPKSSVVTEDDTEDSDDSSDDWYYDDGYASVDFNDLEKLRAVDGYTDICVSGTIDKIDDNNNLNIKDHTGGHWTVTLGTDCNLEKYKGAKCKVYGYSNGKKDSDYNTPVIRMDHKDNRLELPEDKTLYPQKEDSVKQFETKSTGKSTSEDTGTDMKVWIPTNGGKKYHSKSSCSNMEDPVEVTEKEAIAKGFSRCGRCW